MVSDPRHFIVVASRDHVRAAVAGGFIQAGHGKAAPLKRLRPGDRVACYSPKTTFGGAEACQKFTALGTVAEGDIYDSGGGLCHARRACTFEEVGDADVRPLLGKLSFVKDPKAWGVHFRKGLFQITPTDFAHIARAMTGPTEG